ncbi:MAG: mechanosensitive ion channel family protein [Pegethrix bostrychoides GSE-TBD4-15B]|jgi:small conductance mechanosensitive channel|uniref:Mechanosensitive ion channel family protein n=1 Tax=Pegethrix bostrychoides GSE-TBD4-15B TaxID=2839662 RepID=A0A951PDD9_9CYAN|nr:mechanosensitive ion channel family protein [Pegethrix bostrychoides GSE-TBD4-15B]
MPTRLKQLLTIALAVGVTLGISLLMGQPSQAQFSLPEGFRQENIGPPATVTRYGNLETISVESPLSAGKLFTIASPTVYNRSPEAVGDRQTVEQRAAEIQAKLLLLLNRPMNPETLLFDVSQLNNVTIIDARDAQYPRPLVLLSVTEFDADFNGLPIDQLAAAWRKILEQELRDGLKNLPANRQRVNQILVGLFGLTAGLVSVKYGLSKRQKQLSRQKKALRVAVTPQPNASANASADASPDTPAPLGNLAQRRSGFLWRLQQVFSLDHRLAALSFAQWLLFWSLILAWYGGFTWVATISPYLIRNQFDFLHVPLTLLSIWFFTGLAIRISRRLIDRFVISWETLNLPDFIDLGDTQRRHFRSSTIAGAAKGLATIVIILFGLLSALGTLGLPTASVVAIGSLAGLAITFGSQNLVKDLVNGFFILAEDHYAIGDVINLGQDSGLVENLNMRVTQIRSGSGELITIPNSSITQVKNLTRSWSRVEFSVDVAYQTDPDQALAVLQEVAQGLYHDPVWHDKIIAEPAVLGIDSVSHSGMTLTTWIQTAPAQQWAVGREFRLRVRRALAEAEIEIGTPRQTYSLESSLESPAADVLPES